MPETTLKCAVCDKSSAEGIEIRKCGRCKSRSFCSVECQRQDWPSHKAACNAQRSADAGAAAGTTPTRNNINSGKWYDRYRKCEDGSLHFGDLELITWDSETVGATLDPILGEPLGWGNCLASESADMRRRYEVEFGGDDRKMFKYWRQGFRWTCCGTSADMEWGCDHHGTGPTPCQCDFCHMGKPLPDSIYNKPTMERYGLRLPRGPDRRSLNPMRATAAEFGRSFFAMPS